MEKARIVLVVGASAGGSSLLPQLLAQLPKGYSFSVLIVLHLSRNTIGELLLQRLQRSTPWKCQIARNGETVMADHIYIARPDRHLLISKDRILLGQGPRENRYRPSINMLFRSAAASFGPRVIGVILSGLLEDGASGMYAIKRVGGVCIVQDPEEALYPDMPNAVRSILKPDYVLPVSEMGDAVKQAIARLSKKRKVKIPDDILREARIGERVSLGIEQVEDLGKVSALSCPDCGGALWEIKENGHRRFRCHVGHAFSEESLIDAVNASTESSLWVALRMIDERKNLLKRLGERESQKGNNRISADYLRQSKELESHAKKLKQILFALEKKPASRNT
ncbi:MAG TPA: chemotaxis protein CheB [Chryseosolibacter sp.]